MEQEERIAEFIGVMLGDGQIGIYNTKAKDKIKVHRVIKVSLDSRNKEYINYICNLIRKVLNTEPRVYYKKKENGVDISTHKKDKLNYVLNELGLKMSPKRGKMEIPNKYSHNKLSLFVLKGLFDTDGNLNIFNNNGIKYPRIEIKICHSPAQEQIKNILKEFDFNYKVGSLDKGAIRIRINGFKEVRKWFDLVGSSNPVHVNKAKSFLYTIK
jgi:DNA-binding transcriptional regulator WhiA